MRYVFDASSIFEALATERLKHLINNYTVEIVRYELGKRKRLVGDLNEDVFSRLISLTKRR